MVSGRNQSVELACEAIETHIGAKSKVAVPAREGKTVLVSTKILCLAKFAVFASIAK